VSDPVYRRVVLASALWYALGVAWFALVGRHRLVESPEERFAREARREAR
jgi:ethanolamine permease